MEHMDDLIFEMYNYMQKEKEENITKTLIETSVGLNFVSGLFLTGAKIMSKPKLYTFSAVTLLGSACAGVLAISNLKKSKTKKLS